MHSVSRSRRPSPRSSAPPPTSTAPRTPRSAVSSAGQRSTVSIAVRTIDSTGCAVASKIRSTGSVSSRSRPVSGSRACTMISRSPPPARRLADSASGSSSSSPCSRSTKRAMARLTACPPYGTEPAATTDSPDSTAIRAASRPMSITMCPVQSSSSIPAPSAAARACGTSCTVRASAS